MTTPEFDMFWSAWPRNGGGYSRKGGKSECIKVWNKNYNKTQIETILAHVAYMKTTEAWLRDMGAFIPMPITYLRQARWDGADIPKSAVERAVDHDEIYRRQLAHSIASMNGSRT
jgi:hypothetical protein